MNLLEFIFQSLGHFIGTVILASIFFHGIAMIIHGMPNDDEDN